MSNILCKLGFHKLSQQYIGWGSNANYYCLRPNCYFEAYSEDGYYPSNGDYICMLLLVLLFASPIIYGLYEVAKTIVLLAAIAG